MIKKFFAVTTLATLFTAPIAAHAAGTQNQMHVGGILGLALGGGSSEVTYGAEFAYHLDPKMAVGLYFTTFGTSATIGSFEISSSSSTLMGLFDYYLDPALHVGGMLGLFLGSSTNTFTDVSSSSSEFGIGGRAGYEFNVADQITVGPEGNLMLALSGGDPVINLLGAVKYHF